MTRTLGTGAAALDVSQQGLGCMGMSEFYGATRRRRVDRRHPPRARPRRDLPRHRRHVRPVHQRAAGRPGHRRPPRRGRARDQVRQRARRQRRVPRHLRQRRLRPQGVRRVAAAPRRRPHRPLLPAPGRPEHARSRRPWARWPSWSPPARCATSGSPRPSPATIRRAHAVHPITALQTEYSLWTRDREDDGVLATVRELGIGLVAYSPLGRGFLTGQITKPDDLAEDDFRRHNPRFQGEDVPAEPRPRRAGA